MVFVGPVDFGDCSALPDSSRNEQSFAGHRIAGLLESSQSFARYPQTVEKSADLSASPPIKARLWV